MTNNTTQPKTGTVTINGRTYTHRHKYNDYLMRILDVVRDEQETVYATLFPGKVNEEVRFFDVGDTEIVPIPAATTRPRELKDVVAELAKGGVPWMNHPQITGWFLHQGVITDAEVKQWNVSGVLFSPNPFKESPTIIGPEITEEVKP